MKNVTYVMLAAGLIMCLAGAYLIFTEETSTGIAIAGGGILFIGASAFQRKMKK